MKKILSGSILCLAFCLQGCLVLAASQMGYMEATSKYERLYDKYRLEQDEINLDLQRQGLPLQPVEEYRVWLKQQPLKHYEIKAFRSHGVISAKEAKEIKQREANAN